MNMKKAVKILCPFCCQEHKLTDLFPTDSSTYPDTMDLYPSYGDSDDAILVSQSFVSRCSNCMGEYRFASCIVGSLNETQQNNEIALLFLKRQFEIVDQINVESPLLSSGFTAIGEKDEKYMLFTTIAFTIPKYREHSSDSTDNSLSSCYQVAFNVFTCNSSWK